MPSMRRIPFFLPLCLPLGVMVIMMMAGCHDKAPSSELESSNPIVPPFASGLLEETKEPETLQLHPVGGAQAPAQDPMVVIQQARDRVNKNPKDLQALIFLANANYDVQRYQEAADLYEQALKLNSDNPQVRTDRATALYRLGRPKEAVDELNLALASDYHHENALYNMGVIKLAAFDDREGAIAAWTQLKEITQNQQLITKLDAMIAEVKQAPPRKKSDESKNAASGAARPLSPGHPK